MRKKIVVTGGSGFIGTNLLAYLSKNYPEYNILSIDIRPPRISY